MPENVPGSARASPPNVLAIVLAAGASARMARNNLLLEWDGEPRARRPARAAPAGGRAGRARHARRLRRGAVGGLQGPWTAARRRLTNSAAALGSIQRTTVTRSFTGST